MVDTNPTPTQVHPAFEYDYDEKTSRIDELTSITDTRGVVVRFEWIGDALYQRSMLEPSVEWKLSLVEDSVDAKHADYNAKAARAKLMSTNTQTLDWGPAVPADDLAHAYSDMECYSCHTSWTTSCGGCHLPIEANWKTERHHYEGGETRNYATYNPQVARDQMFLLGRRGP